MQFVIAQYPVSHRAAADVNQGVHDHRGNQRPGGQDDAGHDDAGQRGPDGALTSLVRVADAEDHDDERHRAGLSQPRRKEPREIAAIQQLLAEAGGERQRDEPAVILSRMRQHERDGLVSSSWKTTDNNRRARYYALIAAGRRVLADERQKWERQSNAVNLVLRMT